MQCVRDSRYAPHNPTDARALAPRVEPDGDTGTERRANRTLTLLDPHTRSSCNDDYYGYSWGYCEWLE